MTARAAGLAVGSFGLALLLAGCGSVVSDKPWFTREDGKDAPKLREGVWFGSSAFSSPCAVDEKQPIDEWPDCSSPLLVQASDLVALSKKNGQWQRMSLRYVLAPGQPLILQIGATNAGKTQYGYEWVRVTGLDDQGRVTSITGWGVLCRDSTGSMYPGLAAQQSDCTASSIDALRGAAKGSDANATDLAQLHWVRDGAR